MSIVSEDVRRERGLPEEVAEEDDCSVGVGPTKIAGSKRVELTFGKMPLNLREKEGGG